MYSEIRITGRTAARINEHVESCQLCQSNHFCDILERILNEIEQELKDTKEAKKQEVLSKVKKGINT